jgi:predicted nucleic-acid-binding protein
LAVFFDAFKGAEDIAEELARQSLDLGEPIGSSSMWCADVENVYVLLRNYALADEEPDTKVVDTITFDQETFVVKTVQRLLLPSHSSDPGHHIGVSGLNYLDP